MITDLIIRPTCTTVYPLSRFLAKMFLLLIITGATIAASAISLAAADVRPAAHQDIGLVPGTQPSAPSHDTTASRISLGRATDRSFIGKTISSTYYDMQQNGSMGRMIDWGYDAFAGHLTHFTLMYLQTQVLNDPNRNCVYNAADSTGQLLHFPNVPLLEPGERGGYVGIDVTNDNLFCAGGHSAVVGASAYCCFIWQKVPGTWIFSRINVSNPIGEEFAWPKFRYQDVPGQDPVLHVIVGSLLWSGALYYLRKVGADETGVWDDPPYVIDTIFTVSHDIAASNSSGKVALTWTANLPQPGDCDTCSNNDGAQHEQYDNDLYYQISYDYGVTWQPRVNLTKNVDGEDGFRPYTDISALIDPDDNLHLAWSGREWPADANSGGDAELQRCRMFHWCDNVADTAIHTVANLQWDQTTCNGGALQMNGSKMSISWCNNKLYYIWTQFNNVPKGIEDDCAARADTGDYVGAANGDIYLAVSDDGGDTWDQPRNLTNTYSPGCDGSTGGCYSEHWPSMAKLGTDHIVVGPLVVEVDPSGTYAGDWFLDVQYIADRDPGSIAHGEGTCQWADLKWFRLACVDPVPPPATCCEGTMRGNVDDDPGDAIDISDLVYLVDYMFQNGPAPVCWDEANVDGSGDGPPDGSEDIDISDLVYLVDYMFNSGPAPLPCP